MIVTIVRFKLPAGTTRDKAVTLFKQTAPRYRALPGLVRKYYLWNADGTAGGCYLWQTRQQAEQLFTAEWRAYVAERYGAEPAVDYFEAPVIIDNLEGKIAEVA